MLHFDDIHALQLFTPTVNGPEALLHALQQGLNVAIQALLHHGCAVLGKVERCHDFRTQNAWQDRLDTVIFLTLFITRQSLSQPFQLVLSRKQPLRQLPVSRDARPQ